MGVGRPGEVGDAFSTIDEDAFRLVSLWLESIGLVAETAAMRDPKKGRGGGFAGGTYVIDFYLPNKIFVSNL